MAYTVSEGVSVPGLGDDVSSGDVHAGSRRIGP